MGLIYDSTFHRSSLKANDLLTIRGQKIISECPICLYAGSLFQEILAFCPSNATIINTALLDLDIIDECTASDAGLDVARLHSETYQFGQQWGANQKIKKLILTYQ